LVFVRGEIPCFGGMHGMKRLLPLLVGLAIGAGMGLMIGWWLWPVQYTNTAPTELRADYRDEYIYIVAQAYQVENDLTLARERLAHLSAGNPAAPLVELTERLIQRGAASDAILVLTELAHDLGVETARMAPYLRGEMP